MDYARIALSWATLFESAEPGASPDFVPVQLPDWPEDRIRVFPGHGVSYVLGSDYTGEAKKSFLRLFMQRVKSAGGLGLYAGASLHLNDVDSPFGQLFLGLSVTGKITLTSHDFGLDAGEWDELVQDDVFGLLPDGSVVGSESGGLFVKTADLSSDSRPQLYHAATQPQAVFENVAVGPNGRVDLADDTLTANGRASVRRNDIQTAASEINLESVDHLFFIARDPLIPPLARLEPHAAAAAFMLEDSVQSGPSHPSKAGERTRLVGTNPFITGPPGDEGNRFFPSH